MDIGKALTYVTEDERWINKLGIALVMSILSIFLIPAFLLNGYLVAITRNVMNDVERPLPEWEDWGGFLRDGLNVFLAVLVYTLPFWLLMCIATVSTVGFGSLSEVSEDAAAAGIFATFGLVMCLGLLFGLALLFINPAIIIQYVRTSELGACFRFGEVFGIVRDNIADIAIAVGIMFGIIFVIGLVGQVPCIGWVISLGAGAYITALSGHLYGQIAMRAGGAPKEEKFVV